MVTSISGMSGYGFDEAELKKIQDAQFRQMDADGDGKISKQDLVEWAAGVKEKTGKTIDTEKLFKALDHNGDGAISREEFGKGPKKTTDVPTLPTTTLPTAEELDADGDGAISDAEYATLAETIKQMPPPPLMMFEIMQANLNSNASNSDQGSLLNALFNNGTTSAADDEDGTGELNLYDYTV